MILWWLRSAEAGYYATRAKSRLDLTVTRETELHNARLAQYKKLWPTLKPLARYGREKAVTHAALTEVSNVTRDWYFAEGGLYLTPASRKPYFRWKQHMQELLDDKNLQAHPDQPIEEKDLQAMVKAIGDPAREPLRGPGYQTQVAVLSNGGGPSSPPPAVTTSSRPAPGLPSAGVGRD